MSGKCSTNARTVSNEALPEPMTIDARSSTVGIREARSVRRQPLSDDITLVVVELIG